MTNTQNPGNTQMFPSNTEIEEAVIGALLLETTAWARIGQRLSDELFYERRHVLIYQAISRLADEGGKIDMLTATEELRRMGALEEAGGPYNVARLAVTVSSTAHLEYHVEILREMLLRRQLILLTAQLQGMAFDRTQDLDDTLIHYTSGMDKILASITAQQTLRTMDILVPETLRLLQLRMDAETRGLAGIDTGLADLNLLLGGWRPGELVILAARPSMGKTALMLHFARAAAQTGKRILLFSAEMSAESLTERLLIPLNDPDVPLSALRDGTLTEAQYSRLSQRALAELSPTPILIDDEAGMSMTHIRHTARLHQIDKGCDLILIDYLQLTDTSAYKAHSREQEVAAASRMAKRMARETGCPVILLCQLNRKVEERMPGKARPMLSDLRESGSIEQDADVVLLLDRPALRGVPKDPERGYPTENLGILYIAKNRNGATGTVYFTHDRALTHLEKYVPTAEHLRRQSAETEKEEAEPQRPTPPTAVQTVLNLDIPVGPVDDLPF